MLFYLLKYFSVKNIINLSLKCVNSFPNLIYIYIYINMADILSKHYERDGSEEPLRHPERDGSEKPLRHPGGVPSNYESAPPT